MLEVFSPGTEVEIAGGTALILQVCIRDQNHVTYEVSWWQNEARNTAWVSSFEVREYKTKPSQIGFKKC